MRLAVALLASCLVASVASVASAQYSALTVSHSGPILGGRNRVVPVATGGRLVRSAGFTYPVGVTGGCGDAPEASLSNAGTGPMLSRDGRRIVYASARQVLLRNVGERAPKVIATGDFDRPACLVAMAADSSSVLFYRVTRHSGPPDPDDEGGGGGAQIAGQFELYGFANEQTTLWAPDVAGRKLEKILLLDATRIVVLEELAGEGYRRHLVVLDLAARTRTEIAHTEGNAISFGQLGYFAGSLVWLDEGGGVVFHALTPSSSGTRWSTLTGTWAENQWHQLSPSGARLSRVHRTSGTSGVVENALEVFEGGQSTPRSVSDSIYDYRWENDATLLVEQFREARGVRRSFRLARVDVATGQRTELSSRPASARASVVFAD